MPKGVWERRIRNVLVPPGPSIAYVELTQGQWALIDATDAIAAGRFNWHARWSQKGRAFYAAGRPGRRAIYLHTFLCGSSDIDHIDPSRTLDNRRANLRFATRVGQACNQRRRCDNTSGYKGVTRSDRGWHAQIQINRRKISCGIFDTAEKAYEAYCAAAVKYHGEFARVS